jgi:excisionase family DNA binding protein
MEQQPVRNDEVDMLTVQDVCGKLQVSEWTVKQLIRTDRLASVKIGARRLIPRDSLESYVKQLKEG